ncbi:hypothetical protein [Pedobacter panaciterrae]
MADALNTTISGLRTVTTPLLEPFIKLKILAVGTGTMIQQILHQLIIPGLYWFQLQEQDSKESSNLD